MDSEVFQFKMKIMITGVAGLLGSRLADFLIDNGHHVIGIDDMTGGYVDNINPDVDFCEVNIATDLDKLDNIFSVSKPDYVYHLAAYAAEGLSPFIRGYNYTNNLVATANIVTQCIKYNVRRLIFTSTMAVYGHGMKDSTLFNESLPRAPIDPYGNAKAACEIDIEIAGEQHGLDWCIIRPHNVYGEGQNIWDKYRNVLGIWMYRIINKLPVLIYGNGQQTRAFSYIGDSLPSLWKAAIEPKASKEIINLGGIKSHTILNACMPLIRVIGEDDVHYKYDGIPIEFVEPRFEVEHCVPTWIKSDDILGFEHKTDLEQGLRTMWNWAIKQPNREQKLWDKYELDKGIYDYWRN